MTETHQDDDVTADITPRRTPQQARSIERVDRILDAAAQLLAEKGYNAVKTNHIAKRADVSIGSVYQFFPNRFAIFHALAERYRERIAECLAKYIGPDAEDVSWEEAIDGSINDLAEIWRTEWSFFAVWIAIQNTAELRDPDDEYRYRLLSTHLIPFYRRLLPNTPHEQLERIAGVIFDIFSLLLDSSMRSGEEGEQDPKVVDELRTVVKSYLRHYIELDRTAAS